METTVRCRLCTSNVGLRPIFDKPDVEKTSQLLFLITGVRITKDDLLPLVICSPCKEFVQKSKHFRYKCLKAQEVLIKNLKVKLEDPNYKNKYVMCLENGTIVRNDEDHIDNDSHHIDDHDYDKKDLNDYLDVNIKREPTEDEMELRDKEKRKRRAAQSNQRIICQHCGKLVYSRHILRHCRAMHGYERVDKCSYCDYKGCDQTAVTIHERIHTGVRPHVCKVCNASYMRSSAYMQHIGTHLTERNFKCELCPALLKSKYLLTIHKNRHKQEQFAFKCYICSNNFTRRRYAVNHLIKIHGVTPDLSKIVKFKRMSSDNVGPV